MFASFGLFLRFWFICLFVFAFFSCLLVCFLVSKCCLKKLKHTKRSGAGEMKTKIQVVCVIFSESAKEISEMCAAPATQFFFLLFGL